MNPLNGLLLIDKPSGLTSHDVVYQARRILGHRGIGHAGTLDPLATGLLVLLVGEATKVSDYLLNGDKGYRCEVRLGRATDSMDITGQTVSESATTSLTEDRVRAACLELQGTLALKVPVHSAVKVDGKKLYEFAHRGEQPVEVPVREMRFYDLQVVEMDLAAATVTVTMSCSKGSFIRAWANRLGEVLGVGGCVAELRRTLSSPFRVEQAITLEDLTLKWDARVERHGKEIGPAWVPLKDSLPHFRRLDVAGHDEKLLKNGQISNQMRTQLLQFVGPAEAGSAALATPPPVRVIARETDDLLALLLAEPGEFYRIKRVFHRA